MSFFKVFKLLFPRVKSFELVFETKLKKFIRGLNVLPEDVKTETEKVFLDLFPETTRVFDEWEKQFAVLFASEQYGENRVGILKALWKANSGGQSLEYIQGVLQSVFPEIKVFENNPIKNPRDANAVLSCMCGQEWSVCGNKKLSCGFKLGDEKFIPTVIRNDREQTYDIPVDKHYWENYFFVAKDVVRNKRQEIVYCQKLTADAKWKPYVEYLILKMKPVHTGVIVFIEWEENYDATRSQRSVKNA